MARLPSKHASKARSKPQPQCIGMIRHVIEEVNACHCQTRSALPAIQESLLPQVSELDDALEQNEECCERGLLPDSSAFRMALTESDIEIATSLRAEVYHLTQQIAERASECIRKPSAGNLIQRDQAKRDMRRLSDLCDWMDDASQRLQAIRAKQERGAGRSGSQPGRTPKAQSTGRGQAMESKKRSAADVIDADDEFDSLREGSTKRQKTSPSRGQPHRPLLDLCSDIDVETPISADTRRPSLKELRQPRAGMDNTKETHSVDSALASDIASSILRTMGRHPEMPPLNHDLQDVLSRKQLKKNKQRDADVAVAQDKTVKDAVGWWKAQG